MEGGVFLAPNPVLGSCPIEGLPEGCAYALRHQRMARVGWLWGQGTGEGLGYDSMHLTWGCCMGPSRSQGRAREKSVPPQDPRCVSEWAVPSPTITTVTVKTSSGPLYDNIIITTAVTDHQPEVEE